MRQLYQGSMSNVIRKMCRGGGGRGKVGSNLTLNLIILV